MPDREDFALRAVHEWAATLPSLGASPDELSALIRLSRINSLTEQLDDRTLRQFEADGIRGRDDFRTLALLRRSDSGLTNSALIDQLGGSKAGTSTRLVRLAAHNITERIPSQVDRRSHTNALTEHGKALADRVVTEVVAARKQILSALNTKQVSELADSLARIIESIERSV